MVSTDGHALCPIRRNVTSLIPLLMKATDGMQTKSYAGFSMVWTKANRDAGPWRFFFSHNKSIRGGSNSAMRTERAGVGWLFGWRCLCLLCRVSFQIFSYPLSVNKICQFYTRILALAALGRTWDFEF